jgi:uncharacterized protein (TIGR03083 family)
MSMDVDLRLLRYFVAVAEELHVTRAAQRLHISQPVLSRQIRQLEAQLRVQLLRRSRRGVELTQAGEVLLPQARTLLASWDLALAATRMVGAEEASVLRVGFTLPTANRFTPQILDAFKARRPGWGVSVAQARWSDPYAGLLADTVDAALLHVPLPDTDRLVQRVLFTEPRCVAMAASHPFASQDVVRLEQLLQEPLVAGPREAGIWRDYWLCVEERGGVPARIGAEVATPEEWVEAVTLGLGVAVTPQSTSWYYDRPGVVYRPLQGADPCSVAVVWRRGDLRPAVRDFVHCCIAVVAAARTDTVEARTRPPTENSMGALLAALREECEHLSQVVLDLTQDQFQRPTRCTAWDVNGLLAHLFRETQRIHTALAQPPAPRVDADAISYWCRYDPVTNARRTVERVRQVVTAYSSGAKLAMAFDHAWRTALDAAARTDPARPTQSWEPMLVFEEFLKTRLVELTVHGLDLAQALGRPPWASQEGLRVTRDVLVGLLGAPLPDGLAWDEITLAEKGTGRQLLSGFERDRLGPLAERFPLFT